MAIYKLGDICETISDTRKPSFPQEVVNTSDVLLSEVMPVIKEEKVLGQFKKTCVVGDILFSEIRPANGRWAIVEKENKWLLSTKLLVLRSNDKVIPKYLFWLMTSKFIDKISIIAHTRSGSFPQITFSAIKHLKVELPTVSEQQKIIDIIEPMENKILSMISQKNMIKEIIMTLHLEETKEDNIFQNISTGKLNTNCASTDGKYNFYTCGSKILKSNHNSFKGQYILLSGNGELYSWWEDGSFDLYQRVYALTPNKDFFTTLLSVRRGIRNLRKRSNGAVIKFIKLEDIKSIKILDNKYENELETLFRYEKKLDDSIRNAKILKKSTIKLLIK